MSAPRAPREMASGVIAGAIASRGYAVVPGLLSTDEVASARDAIDRVVARLAPPTFYSCSSLPIEHPDVPGPVAVTAVGLTIPRAHGVLPELAPLLLRSRALEPMRAALGDTMRLETIGAVISDEARPFFPWHTHIDGKDEGVRLRAGEWPEKDEVERVLMLVYLTDLDDDAGSLLVYPRRAGEPTAPPYDITATSWPGQVELRLRAGDAVMLEQCTWHAARPRLTKGSRTFIACYFASDRVAAIDVYDPSLSELMPRI